MEDMEDKKSSVDAYSMGSSTKAFTKALMKVMEAFAEVMEASMEA